LALIKSIRLLNCSRLLKKKLCKICPRHQSSVSLFGLASNNSARSMTGLALFDQNQKNGEEPRSALLEFAAIQNEVMRKKSRDDKAPARDHPIGTFIARVHPEEPARILKDRDRAAAFHSGQPSTDAWESRRQFAWKLERTRSSAKFGQV
jgi:hypothetical protein